MIYLKLFAQFLQNHHIMLHVIWSEWYPENTIQPSKTLYIFTGNVTCLKALFPAP